MSTKHNLLYFHKGNENLSPQTNPHLCPWKAAMDKLGSRGKRAGLCPTDHHCSTEQLGLEMHYHSPPGNVRQEKLLCKFTFALELRVHVPSHLASAHFSVPRREVCRNHQSFTILAQGLFARYLLFTSESEQGGKWPVVQTAAELRSNPASRLLYFPHHNT